MSDSVLLAKIRDITLENGPGEISASILSNDLLCDLILASATPATIFRIARTCRAAYASARSYLDRAFQVDRLFSRYFDDPLAFRSLQARTGTLVSGSTALQFFDRVTYEGSDLDLYVTYFHKEHVAKWIMSKGYVFQPDKVQDPDFDIAVHGNTRPAHSYYTMKGINSIFTFTKPSPVPSEATELKIQMIVTCHTPMEVILYFHSTVVLNVISWDAAYSLYPRATFEDRVSIFLRGNGAWEASVIAKYKERGWTFKSQMPAMHFGPNVSDRALTTVPRWIGDGYSWVIKLNTTGIPAPTPTNRLSRAMTRDPCYIASWTMVPHARGSLIEFTISKHAVGTYHQYPVCSSFNYWYDIIEEIQMRYDTGIQMDLGPGYDYPVVKQYFDQLFVEYCETHLEEGREWKYWKPWAN